MHPHKHILKKYLAVGQRPLARLQSSTWLTNTSIALCWEAESYIMRAEVEDGFEDVAYSETALVYQALEDFPVSGQVGVVVGSIMPWAEAILFVAGAGTPGQQAVRCAGLISIICRVCGMLVVAGMCARPTARQQSGPGR